MLELLWSPCAPVLGYWLQLYSWDQTLNASYRNWTLDFLHWPALKFLHAYLEGPALVLPDPSWHPAMDLSLTTSLCACILMIHSTWSWRGPLFSLELSPHWTDFYFSVLLISRMNEFAFPIVRFQTPEICLSCHWASSYRMSETSVSGCCRLT